jgi:hypothetical protein
MIGESWKPKLEEIDVGGLYAQATLYDAAVAPGAQQTTVESKEILEELAVKAADNDDEGMFKEYHRRLNTYVD